MIMKLNLHVKIIGIVLLLSLLLFVSSVYIYVSSYDKDLKNIYIEKAKATAYSLDVSIEDRKDLANVDKLLSVIHKQIWLDQDIIDICLIIPQEEEFRFYVCNDQKKIGKTAGKENIDSFKRDILINSIAKTDESRTLTVTTPIHSSGKIIGTYQIEITLENLDKKLNDELITSLLMFLLIITFFIFALYFVLKSIIITPIFEINKGMDAVSNENYSYVIKVHSDDEIGALSRSFNSMIEILDKSSKTMKDYAANLENSVKERTKELEQKDINLINANSKLEEANQRLTILDKEKDEFISVAAHELKTPLTSIKGFSQLLREPKIMNDKNKRIHYLELINSNTIRLYNLILDIVDSSRLNLGKLSLDIKTYTVEPIFNEIKENMEVIIKEKGIKPDFIIEKNIPKINTDSARLLQVLKNLLINAVHFTEKGTISLCVSKKGKFVLFEVKDTGEGIPKDKQSNIFSKFYQADASITRKVKGSGLGLSLSKGLVENMGGKIWFESVEGKGSTFFFTMPIAK
ncbi:MAG: ATP-binding protein [archaeon]